jgi:hypothetical protein
MSNANPAQVARAPTASMRISTEEVLPARGSSKRRDLRHFELPGLFARHYRPVRVHPHEMGLAAFVLDEYGLRFFRIMATATPVPETAIWSLVPNPAGRPALHIVSSRLEDACGYLVCEVPHASADQAAYAVPPRLSYRAKVTITALQFLVSDLTDHPSNLAAADVIAFIERRIEQLRT